MTHDDAANWLNVFVDDQGINRFAFQRRACGNSILYFINDAVHCRRRLEGTEVFMRKGAKTAASDFRIALGMRKYAYEKWLVGMVEMLETRVPILD